MAASDIFKFKSRWVTYEGSLHINTLVGGIPKDPDTIRAWIKASLKLNEHEVMAVAEETIAAMGKPVAEMSSDELDEVAESVMSDSLKGNGFKRADGKPDGELLWEGRCLMAAINEAANALYPGVTKWPGHPGNTKKGLENYAKERIEVRDTYFPLGRNTPDRPGEQRIKHISGPQGKRSTINVVDVVDDVKIDFTIDVLDDCISEELWFFLWQYVEKGGVGADRGRGDGRCQLTRWEKVS